MTAEPDDMVLPKGVRRLSAELGSDPMLVQGAGGNVSWKAGDTLWIKASGTWLADAERAEIFVPVDLAKLSRELKAGDFDAKPTVLGESQLRPSIETLLHVLMPQRIVVHLHAIDVLAYLVRTDARDLLMSKALPSVVPAFLPYRKPGAELAQEAAQAIAACPEANVLYLGNHGLVVGGGDVHQVRLLLNTVRGAWRSQVGGPGPSRDAIRPLTPDLALKWCPLAGLHDLALDEQLLGRLQSSWALYPDHVVFLGPMARVFDNETALREWTRNHPDQAPDVVFVRGMGVYGAHSMAAGKLAQLQCFRDVLVRVPRSASLRTLNDQDVRALLNWDAEHYRMQLAK